MFELFTIQDQFMLEPNELGDIEYYLKEKVIDRYHQKLIQKVGYCVKIERIHKLTIDESETS